MDNNDHRLDLKDLMRQQATLGAPKVHHLRPYIRSGEQFIFSGIDDRTGTFLGGLVIEWGYDVKDNKHDAFRKWLDSKEDSLRQAASNAGRFAYRGTYAVVNNPHRRSGDYRTIWTYEDSNALGEFNQALARQPSDFRDLMQEFLWFVDRENVHAGLSETWFQPARRTTRLEPKQPPGP